MTIRTMLVMMLMGASLGGCSATRTSSSDLPSEQPTTGTVRGVVDFEGPIKSRRVIQTDVDANLVAYYRNKPPLLAEHFVISDDRKVQNVVIWVSSNVDGSYAVPEEPAIVRILGGRYDPHIIALRAGQELHLFNNDLTVHVTNIASEANTQLAQRMFRGPGPLIQKFDHPDMNASLTCQVHGWMRARLLVFDHPFFAVTASDGTFELTGLPPGEH